MKISFVYIAVFYFFQATSIIAQETNTDSLINAASLEKSKAKWVTLQNKIGISYMMKGDLANAETYFRNGIAESIHANLFEKIRGLSELGNILSVRGLQKNASDTFLLIKEQIEAGADNEEIKRYRMRFYKYMGDFYSRSNLFQESINYLQQSEDEARKNKDELHVAKCQSSIAINYAKLKNWDRTIAYNQNAIAIFRKMDFMPGQANQLSNLATIYKEKGINDSAAFYANAAMQIYEELQMPLGISQCKSLVAELAKDAGETSKALRLYQDLIAYDQSIEMNNNLGYDHQAIGFIYKKIGLPDSTIYQHKLAIPFFQEASLQKELSTSYEEVMLAYIQKGVKDSAAAYLELFRTAYDEYLNEEKIKAIEGQEIKYQTRLKEATIDGQMEVIKKQKQQNLFLIIGGGLALAISLVLGLLIRKMSQQKAQILLQKQEIIHNNRNNIQQLISIFGRQAEQEGLKENSLANQERLYTLNVLNKLLYETGDGSGANIKELLKQIGEAKQVTAARDVDIQINTPSLTLKSNLLKDIGLIINELTTNSIKYAFENTKYPLIKVDLTKKENYLNITVADNGAGLPASFSLDQQRKSFGLDFVKDLVEQHHGTISVNSDNGTRFDISLKI